MEGMLKQTTAATSSKQVEVKERRPHLPKRRFQRFALAALAGASLLLASAAQSPGRAADQPVFPPAQNDPRAQFSPELQNLSPLRLAAAPQRSLPLTAEQATREVTFDMRTRRGLVSALPATLRPLVGPTVSPGHTGIGETDPEPQSQGSRFVFGADNRIRISSTGYPWSAQCKLYTTFPDGKVCFGSATMIASRHALTAGHCVYSAAHGGWARSIRVVPCEQEFDSPFGEAWTIGIHTYSGWTAYASPDHDFALITLDRNVGNYTGWLGYGYWSSLAGVTGHLSGYPLEKEYGHVQYYTSGSILAENGYRLFYQLDTMPGDDGAGIYRFVGTGRYVMAVNAYYSSYLNSGTRIDAAKFNSLKSWIVGGF